LQRFEEKGNSASLASQALKIKLSSDCPEMEQDKNRCDHSAIGKLLPSPPQNTSLEGGKKKNKRLLPQDRFLGVFSHI